MHPLLLLTAYLVIQTVAIIVMIVGVKHAPLGYEDRNGFHRIVLRPSRHREIKMGGRQSSESQAPFAHHREVTHSP